MYLTLFFCDDAQSTPEGKLNVTGIFDELYAPGFPAQQDSLVLAGSVTWSRTDSGSKEIKIDVLGPNQKCIFTIEAQTDVEQRPPERAPSKSHLIFPLENLTFNVAGDHYVQVTIDEKQHRAAPLHLIRSET